MRKLAIVESLGRTVNRVGFKLKKHSPEILVVNRLTETYSAPQEKRTEQLPYSYLV